MITDILPGGYVSVDMVTNHPERQVVVCKSNNLKPLRPFQQQQQQQQMTQLQQTKVKVLKGDHKGKNGVVKEIQQGNNLIHTIYLSISNSLL